MASLQSSCTVLSTHHRHRVSHPSLTDNTTHLLPGARRSHHFKVSCNGGRIDRRNMLLGLGGLYGAANLISQSEEAHADPIQPPDFSKCGAAYDSKTGDLLDVNCCPPISDTIIDYELPPVTALRTRPAAHKLSHVHLAKYEEAIRRMKELDVTDPNDPRGYTQQANIHCAYCNGAHDQVGYRDLDISIHFSWLFFPFHRWYLYFYEKILGELIGDPTFSLPFWNWDNPPGMTLPRIFDNDHSPLFDENRNEGHRRGAIVDLALNSGVTQDLQKVTNNLSVMYREMVRSGNSVTDFMGKPYFARDRPPATANGGKSELGSHTSVHVWVGDPDNPYHEDLGNFYSAGRDPVFFSHHANVDRMWTIWKTLKSPPNYKDLGHSDYLNASFLFYDEKKRLVRVKVGDCVDNKALGYEYEKMDIPWLNYTPPKRAAGVKIEDISKGAENADKIFPLKLEKITRVLVSKTKIGNVNEVLVLEDIETDPRQLVKFDVYINDEDDVPTDVNKAEYVGTFAQLPHRSHAKKTKGSLSLSLKDVYDDIDIGDDDTVVVTIVPRFRLRDITIGDIKIVAATA